MSENLVLRPDVVATVLDEGALLVDLDSKYFFVLNGSGWALTTLLESGASVDHVVAEAARCGASADEARAFVDSLRGVGIVETTDHAANIALEWDGAWEAPTVARQDEPLHDVIVNAFDPSIPLAE